MIASLTGILKELSDHSVIIDVNGVGYEVSVVGSSLKNLPPVNETVHFRIFTYVREDIFQLYGFQSEDEKKIFLLVLGISGIGPKLAAAVLSGLGPAEFISAVRRGDAIRLSSVPGIGKKTAERMVLELKEKVKTFRVNATGESGSENLVAGDMEDAVSALINLGYKPPQAREAVRQVLETVNGGGVEEVVKKSLKMLSKA